MGEQAERVLGMFDKALEMESRGRSFYKEAHATCKNEVGREIFKMLMNDEVVHMERIKKIYDSIEKGRGFSDEWKEMGIGHRDLKKFFREMAAAHGEDISTDTSDVEAIDVGIDFESRAVAFYKEHLTAADDPREREFIEAMIEEERSHHAALTDMRYYLTDPAAWFSEKEHWGLDGG
jgi:rubrerythrin